MFSKSILDASQFKIIKNIFTQFAVTSTSEIEMVVKEVDGLGEDAFLHPKKYNGFMGISMPHKFFSKDNMERYFVWASGQFDKFVTIIMDDPDKYNFMVFKNLSDYEALAKARVISDEIKRGYERILRKHNITNIQVVQFRDFVLNPEYLKILKSLNHFVTENLEFKSDLMGMLEMGIGAKFKEYSSLNALDSSAIDNSKSTLFQYILEELACLLFFVDKGFLVEIDPHQEFSTKKLIYKGDFPEILNDLKMKNRGHIYVKPQGYHYKYKSIEASD